MKKWMKSVLGIIGIVLVVIAMTSAAHWQATNVMTEPDIIVHMKGDPLITKDEVQNFLRTNQLYTPGMKYEDIHFNEIEKALRKRPEILKVKVYTQIGNKWSIDIQQRNPIVHVFNERGQSFYIDELGHCITSNVNHASRVLVANGNIDEGPSDKDLNAIMNNDSLKTIDDLANIYRISKYVCNDPFLTSQIGQVYLQKDGDYVLVPQVGDQTIVFGTAYSDEEVAEKFKKLEVFYKEGMPFEGWRKYKEINLKYKDQIVCKKR